MTYTFREVGRVSATIGLNEGDHMTFGTGAHGGSIDEPDPDFCNLKLAIARALHACGAADIIAKIYDDDDDEVFDTQSIYFGGPHASDDLLSRRLDDRLISHV